METTNASVILTLFVMEVVLIEGGPALRSVENIENSHLSSLILGQARINPESLNSMRKAPSYDGVGDSRSARQLNIRVRAMAYHAVHVTDNLGANGFDESLIVVRELKCKHCTNLQTLASHSRLRRSQVSQLLIFHSL